MNLDSHFHFRQGKTRRENYESVRRADGNQSSAPVRGKVHVNDEAANRVQSGVHDLRLRQRNGRLPGEIHLRARSLFLKNPLQGDSGGPLFIETDQNRYVVFGVVSFGDGCARPFPGIYGKLATSLTHGWIMSMIAQTPASLCSVPPSRKRRMRLLVPPQRSYRVLPFVTGPRNYYVG